MIGYLTIFFFVLFAPFILAAPTPEQIAIWQSKMPIKKPSTTPSPIQTPPPKVEPVVISEPTTEPELFRGAQ